MLYSLLLLSVISFSVCVDTNLSKIISESKRTECFNVLHSEDPDHYSRLWLVGFLKWVGYTIDEICSIIDKEACWQDYDPRMTWCQVSSVFRRNSSNGAISSHFEGVGSAPGGTLESPPYERKRPCAVRWILCRDCPDLVNHHCMWVTRK